jgi:hypothetical protein
MAGNGCEESWERARSLLAAAHQRLSDPEGNGVADYLDYADHNEFGLAFDVLVEVGDSQRAAKPFWEAVQRAAQAMALSTTDAAHGRSVQTVREWLERDPLFPCPCCGHLVFDEPPGSYNICPICFWEDDNIQLRWPDWTGGANAPSLIESQRNYLQTGAMEHRFTGIVRGASDDEARDNGWRPIDLDLDSFEPMGVSEAPWPDDLRVLYWWRPTFWRRARPDE